MANLIERFKLEESKQINKRYKRVPGSSAILSMEEEKFLVSMTVFECRGKKGLYKALKVVFDINDKLVELSPWPTLDFTSMEKYEHMDDVDPKFVTFFQQIDTETGETYNKVHLTDQSDEKEVEYAIETWNKREN